MDRASAIPGLLSRGPQVRVLPGAPFPKQFAHFDRRTNRRRTQIEKRDRSCECAPHFAHSISQAFPRARNPCGNAVLKPRVSRPRPTMAGCRRRPARAYRTASRLASSAVCATNAFGMGIDRPDIEAEGSRDVCPLFIDTPLVWADHPRCPSGGVGAWRSIGAATAVPADVARGIG